MGHEEIALAITKKLRLFTLFKRHRKMFLDRVFTIPESRDHELDDFVRSVETNRLSSALVDQPGSVAAVNCRGDTCKRSELGENRFTQTPFEELRNNKQIGFHQLFMIRARSHRRLITCGGAGARYLQAFRARRESFHAD